MKLLLLLFFALIHLVPAGARQLTLKNVRTGRQKEIRPGDRIKIHFTTQFEQLQVRQQGRVLVVTDSTLSYTLPFRSDTVTVALSQVTGIGKYSVGGDLALAGVAGALGGVTMGIIERNNGESNTTPTRNRTFQGLICSR